MVDFQTKLIRDVGAQKALIHEHLIIPKEIRKNRENLKSVIDFKIKIIPKLIKNKGELKIKNYKGNKISPYPLKIESFLLDRSQYSNTIHDLIQNLDKDVLYKIFRDKNKIELIGIDESKVEKPFQGCVFAYLKSVAFRISKCEHGQDEAIGPVVRDLRVSFRGEGMFEKKNQFWGYLRNMYVAWIAIKNAIHCGYHPIVFMHGPLVRAIGGFTDIILSKEEAVRVFSIRTDELDTFEGSVFSEENIEGEDFLREFHEIELKNYHIIYGYPDEDKRFSEIKKDFVEGSLAYKIKESIGVFRDDKRRDEWAKALPIDPRTGDQKDFKDREKFIGLSIYFYLLNKLYTVCKKHNVYLASVVENVENSTEFVQYVLPTLFYEEDIPSKIRKILNKTYGMEYPTYPKQQTSADKLRFSRKLYKYIFNMIYRLNITDAVVLTYLLDEGEFTTPLQTYRYFTRKFYEENLGHTEYGIDNDYEGILEFFFNPQEKGILFSYLRTTPLREPIRVEFFDIYGVDYKYLLGATYLLSLFYYSYGLPIILYYVDKIARTHKRLFDSIIEHVVYLTLRDEEFTIEDVLRLSGHFSRKFWERG